MLGNIDYRRLIDYSHPHLTDCELLLKALPTLRGDVFYDLSPHGRHGTLTNMDPASDWVPSQRGIVLDPDGSNDYVEVTDGTDLYAGTGPVTCCAWMRTTMAEAGWICITGKGSTGGKRYGIVVSSGDLLFTTDDDSSVAAAWADDIAYNDGEWHFVCGVRQPDGVIKVYVNGVLKDSVAGPTGSLDQGTTLIGCVQRADNDSLIQFFAGQLDDIRIYSRALTAEEIRDIYLDTLGMRYSWLNRVGAGLPVMSYYVATEPTAFIPQIIYYN